MGLALDRAGDVGQARIKRPAWGAAIHWPRALALFANVLAWVLIIGLVFHLVSRAH